MARDEEAGVEKRSKKKPIASTQLGISLKRRGAKDRGGTANVAADSSNKVL
jgi:hypothetical protein